MDLSTVYLMLSLNLFISYKISVLCATLGIKAQSAEYKAHSLFRAIFIFVYAKMDHRIRIFMLKLVCAENFMSFGLSGSELSYLQNQAFLYISMEFVDVVKKIHSTVDLSCYSC